MVFNPKDKELILNMKKYNNQAYSKARPDCDETFTLKRGPPPTLAAGLVKNFSPFKSKKVFHATPPSNKLC